ncbi:MAG: cyclic nucleotide-binding domain-containing protein [Rhodospirillales bacterium]|nr:cyclic nucleotide-binding domain-containing protein [Rhodospirillales bacterium]
MKSGFTKTSYEVLVSDRGRWTIDSVHAARTLAMETAETVLARKQHEGVKVTAKKDSSAEEKVIFEEIVGKAEKPISIAPIDKAPLCGTLDEYYQFKSRRTISRLLRHYLDEHSLTALEFLYSIGHLRMLERSDVLFVAAMHRVAGIQAKVTGQRPTDRLDELYAAFAKVKERAKGTGDHQRADTLRTRGLNALLDNLQRTVAAENQDFHLLGALAAYLGDGSDWNDKLELVLDLAEGASGPRALGVVDEMVAEILDPASAILELLGGQADAFSAHRLLIALSQGVCKVPKYARPGAARLNDFLRRIDLPQTKRVLLERVARELSSVRPLTREGGTVERNAFANLVSDLREPAGLIGGPDMCEAVTLRGRRALRENDADEDLTIADSMAGLLALMSSRAVQMGYLLDLAKSTLGEKNKAAVLGALASILKQVAGGAALIHANGPGATIAEATAALKSRLDPQRLPDELLRGIATTLDRLLDHGKSNGHAPQPSVASVRRPVKPEIQAPKSTDETSNRKVYPAGSLIFSEGDPGNAAYLVHSGKVQIFHKKGTQEIPLAVLGRGEIFGEMSLVDNMPRMASARAIEESDLTIITDEMLKLKERLEKLEKSDPILRKILGVMVNRLRSRT